MLVVVPTVHKLKILINFFLSATVIKKSFAIFLQILKACLLNT